MARAEGGHVPCCAAILYTRDVSFPPCRSLDHIWLFATRLAEDPTSTLLSREGFAQAVHNLIKLVSARWEKNSRPPYVAAGTLPRLFHAGRFHASKCLKQLTLEQLQESIGGERGAALAAHPVGEYTLTRGCEQSSANYRSLGTADCDSDPGPYGDRLDGTGTDPAEEELDAESDSAPPFSPLEPNHLSKQLRLDALALLEDPNRPLYY